MSVFLVTLLISLTLPFSLSQEFEFLHDEKIKIMRKEMKMGAIRALEAEMREAKVCVCVCVCVSLFFCLFTEPKNSLISFFR